MNLPSCGTLLTNLNESYHAHTFGGPLAAYFLEAQNSDSHLNVLMMSLRRVGTNVLATWGTKDRRSTMRVTR